MARRRIPTTRHTKLHSTEYPYPTKSTTRGKICGQLRGQPRIEYEKLNEDRDGTHVSTALRRGKDVDGRNKVLSAEPDAAARSYSPERGPSGNDLDFHEDQLLVAAIDHVVLDPGRAEV